MQSDEEIDTLVSSSVIVLERRVAEYVRESPSILFELPGVDQVHVSQANIQLIEQNCIAHQEYSRISTHFFNQTANAVEEIPLIDCSENEQNEDNQMVCSHQTSD